MKSIQQLMRFGVAGVCGFIADAGVLYLALYLGAGYFLGRAISFLFAVWVTWRVNRKYTFKAQTGKPLWAEMLQYLAAMSMGGACNYTAYSLTVIRLPGLPYLPLVAVAIGSVAGTAVNFLSAKFWVFRQ